MHCEKHNLKISLQELRKLIDVNKDGWQCMYSTNCYAYALGLDIPQNNIIDYAYAPGIMSNADIDLTRQREFSYGSLIVNLYSDFKALDITFREIEPLDEIDNDEWKIALFTTPYYSLIEDYHFLRQHKDGFWYHKDGFKPWISKYDDYSNIIVNPMECYLDWRIYRRCYALRLKK